MAIAESVNEFYATEGQAIRVLRCFYVMSTEVLAEKIGSNKTYINAIERGRVEMSNAMRRRIAEVFKIKPAELMIMSQNLQNIDGCVRQIINMR